MFALRFVNSLSLWVFLCDVSVLIGLGKWWLFWSGIRTPRGFYCELGMGNLKMAASGQYKVTQFFKKFQTVVEIFSLHSNICGGDASLRCPKKGNQRLVNVFQCFGEKIDHRKNGKFYDIAPRRAQINFISIHSVTNSNYIMQTVSQNTKILINSNLNTKKLLSSQFLL